MRDVLTIYNTGFERRLLMQMFGAQRNDIVLYQAEQALWFEAAVCFSVCPSLSSVTSYKLNSQFQGRVCFELMGVGWASGQPSSEIRKSRDDFIPFYFL